MPKPEGELTFFQFVCPPEKVSEARALFQEKQLGVLDPEVTEGPRVLKSASGEILSAEGIIIEGLGRVDKQQEILHELADRDISGYSRETQVLWSTTATIVWKQE